MFVQNENVFVYIKECICLWRYHLFNRSAANAEAVRLLEGVGKWNRHCVLNSVQAKKCPQISWLFSNFYTSFHIFKPNYTYLITASSPPFKPKNVRRSHGSYIFSLFIFTHKSLYIQSLIIVSPPLLKKNMPADLGVHLTLFSLIHIQI